MKKIILLLLIACGTAFAQKPVFTTAKVKAATVYSNSAEITQTASITLPAGTSEIVVKNVANYLIENTVQIAAPANLTVLSVQFTNNYIAEYEPDETSPAIKKVRDSITLLNKELDLLANEKAAEQMTLQLLDKNNQVYGQETGLSVAELTKMVDYYKAERTKTSNAISALSKREQRLIETLAQLNNRLTAVVQQQEKVSSGKLVLQVMNDAASTVVLDISYLSQNASWQPFYDLRANNTTDPINLLYKAQVVQQTGIDWNNVKLTLSSGTPNQSNTAPELNPWFVYYQRNYRHGDNDFKTLEGQVAGLTIANGSGQPGAESTIAIRGYSTINGNIKPLYVIDGVPVDEGAFSNMSQDDIANIQVLKDASSTSIYGNRGVNGVVLVTTKRGKYKEDASVTDYTQITENQMNVSFDIDIPYDILSNGKKHSITMKEIKLPAAFRHFAVPKMEQEAFLMAEITDYSKYNLLRGEANIIFEGLYAGKTYIDPEQTTDTLSLSMGRDKKISIEREKVIEKSGAKFLSSRKEQTFTYDITVRNNKKEAAQILVKDQYPLSTDKEIEVELLESSGAKVNTETGLLEWDLKLKPGETKKLRLSYRVKSPKNRNLGNL